MGELVSCSWLDLVSQVSAAIECSIYNIEKSKQNSKGCPVRSNFVRHCRSYSQRILPLARDVQQDRQWAPRVHTHMFLPNMCWTFHNELDASRLQEAECTPESLSLVGCCTATAPPQWVRLTTQGACCVAGASPCSNSWLQWNETKMWEQNSTSCAKVIFLKLGTDHVPFHNQNLDLINLDLCHVPQIAAFMQLSRGKDRHGHRESFQGVFNRIDTEGKGLTPMDSQQNWRSFRLLMQFPCNLKMWYKLQAWGLWLGSLSCVFSPVKDLLQALVSCHQWFVQDP